MKDKVASDQDERQLKLLNFIYQDFLNLIKFMETKLAALLTLEIGIIYFIFNSKIFNDIPNYVIAVIILTLMYSVFSVLFSFWPSKAKENENYYYYHTWIQFVPKVPNNQEEIKMLKEQCYDLAKVIYKKEVKFKKNVRLFVITTTCLFFYHFIILLIGRG